MAKSNKPEEADLFRTRLFLIVPDQFNGPNFAETLNAVLAAGDVASVLFLKKTDGTYPQDIKNLVEIVQRLDVAALLHDDSQMLGRCNADGLHLDGAVEDIVETVKAHSGRAIMGVGDLTTRHDAMMMGDGPVDYLFFGRLDGDTGSDIFKKSFALAEWWSSLFEVPAVVMGGNQITSVKTAADAGIEFVALKDAIWAAEDPTNAVKQANSLLDEAFLQRSKRLG